MAPESEILDIAEAAAFLRVSETSLRRWTNAGHLPCFRIGGRRERRFRRSDLLAFLESPGVPTPRRARRHACALYTSAAERERLAGEFLLGGLASGGACFLAGTPRARQGILAWVGRERPAAPGGDRVGPLFLGSYGELPAEQLEAWARSYAWATEEGYAGIHAVGDVGGAPFLRARAFDEVLAYEREYDDALAPRYPVDTLCLYDARRLSGVQAARIIDAHGGCLA